MSNPYILNSSLQKWNDPSRFNSSIQFFDYASFCPPASLLFVVLTPETEETELIDVLPAPAAAAAGFVIDARRDFSVTFFVRRIAGAV